MLGKFHSGLNMLGDIAVITNSGSEIIGGKAVVQ